jgi:hypothetical protein
MRKLFPVVYIASALFCAGAAAQDHDGDWERSRIQHVLLISIDGMHAVELF